MSLIIILRYFKDKTQGEVAKQMGVSQVQIARLENKILDKIKEKEIKGIKKLIQSKKSERKIISSK